MYYKDFDVWNTTKQRIQKEERAVNIRRGEVRWVSLGVNVGVEIDGKGVSFCRPALIIHVIGPHLALIIPLSTKLKNIAGYMPFEWKGTTTALCIHQMRVVSQKRILHRMGRISEHKLQFHKNSIKKFFSL